MQPFSCVDAWHFRAAFHFLTERADQRACLRVMDQALVSGGHAIIGRFAPDGPENCSGLPVVSHDAVLLAERLGRDYRLMTSINHDHHTPWLQSGGSNSACSIRFEHSAHLLIDGHILRPLDLRRANALGPGRLDVVENGLDLVGVQHRSKTRHARGEGHVHIVQHRLPATRDVVG